MDNLDNFPEGGIRKELIEAGAKPLRNMSYLCIEKGNKKAIYEPISIEEDKNSEKDYFSLRKILDK